MIILCCNVWWLFDDLWRLYDKVFINQDRGLFNLFRKAGIYYQLESSVDNLFRMD